MDCVYRRSPDGVVKIADSVSSFYADKSTALEALTMGIEG
jgi:hypothetical protein